MKDRKEENKKYYLKHKQERLEYQKQYYVENSKTRIEYTHLYNSQNKEKIAVRQSNYQKEHRKELNKKSSERKNKNPLLKIKCNLHNTLIHSIKKDKHNKCSNIVKALGCSIEDFKLYLSSQFKDGMTFNNHGEWEIDHIIPISQANDYETIIKLFHYTNLQPLWKEENHKKGSKVYFSR